MSFFSLAQNKALQAAAAVGALVAAPAAFAQDAGGAAATFTTTLTALTADVTQYGGALVGIAAVGVAFMVGIKYIKKIRGAA